MGDLISRQQAVDTLRKMQTYKLFAGDDMILIDKAQVQTELMMLPSAQPELKELSEWKADFKGYINALNMPKDDYDGIMEYIDEVPSAQPETAKRIVGKSRDGMTLWYQCDMCNEPVDEHDNFCRGCGRRLIDETD